MRASMASGEARSNVTASSPLHFWCKKRSKRPTPKSSFFRVRRQKWCLSLQIRSFSAENQQTFAVLRIPFSAQKSLRIPARRARHRLSPLCHRSLFGCKSAQKQPQFRNSFSAGFSAARQPAEDLARSPTARRGFGLRSVSPPSLSPLMSPLRPAPFLVQKALKTVESEEFVFPCRTVIWPVIKDMLFMPFFVCFFLDRKPCFCARAFFVKTICFSEVENLGEGGGP